METNGLEPITSRMQSRRSTIGATSPKIIRIYTKWDLNPRVRTHLDLNQTPWTARAFVLKYKNSPIQGIEPWSLRWQRSVLNHCTISALFFALSRNRIQIVRLPTGYSTIELIELVYHALSRNRTQIVQLETGYSTIELIKLYTIRESNSGLFVGNEVFYHWTNGVMCHLRIKRRVLPWRSTILSLN